MDDVWTGPEGANPAAPQPTPDALKDPMVVPTLVMEDLKAHVGGYFAAGTGYLAAAMVLVCVVMGAVGLGVLPGILLEDETLLAVGGVLGFALYTILLFAFALVAYPLMTASLMRAMDEQRRGGPSIGFMSPFRELRKDAGRIVAFYALLQVAVMVGALFFYIPGIIAMVVGTFAMPMVVFENVGAIDAFKMSWEHIKNHAAWHLPMWILMFVALIILQFTIVGLLVVYPVMVAFQLFAYRTAYGDEGALAAQP